MKKILVVLMASTLFFGCADKKGQKKAILDSVLSIHNKVMGTDGELTDNQMKLDTLIKMQKLSAKDTAFLIRQQLIVADSAMSTWMHNFDVDQKGKSDDETITYMRAQKKLLMGIDSQINKAVAESNSYLVKIKKK